MPAFLKDISAFYGTGAKNQEGQDLESFLIEYDAQKYENPSVTVDILVFQSDKGFDDVSKGLKLLMIKRKNHPSIGYWALPGGFAEMREDLIDSARRELEEETHLSGIAMEQLYTWGEYKRDPRGRIVTVSFLALVDGSVKEIKADDDAEDAAWMDVQFSLIGQEEIIENGRPRERMNYELLLSNKEKDIHLEATVAVTKNKEGILKEEYFQVLTSEGIAFDHPRFIVQALLK